MTNHIDAKELNKRLTSGDPVTLLDVRRQTDAEADPRCIAGAVYRNPEKMDVGTRICPQANP
jgi:hypothetical protein